MSTILLVEDDLNTRIGLQEILTEEGYQVESAEDGATAIDKMKSGLVDLLLSDLRLPDISGLKLHEKVKQWNPNSTTIIMTAHCSPDSQLQARELGVFSWFTKPLNIEALLSTIKKAL